MENEKILTEKRQLIGSGFKPAEAVRHCQRQDFFYLDTPHSSLFPTKQDYYNDPTTKFFTLSSDKMPTKNSLTSIEEEKFSENGDQEITLMSDSVNQETLLFQQNNKQSQKPFKRKLINFNRDSKKSILATPPPSLACSGGQIEGQWLFGHPNYESSLESNKVRKPNIAPNTSTRISKLPDKKEKLMKMGNQLSFLHSGASSIFSDIYENKDSDESMNTSFKSDPVIFTTREKNFNDEILTRPTLLEEPPLEECISSFGLDGGHSTRSSTSVFINAESDIDNDHGLSSTSSFKQSRQNRFDLSRNACAIAAAPTLLDCKSDDDDGDHVWFSPPHPEDKWPHRKDATNIAADHNRLQSTRIEYHSGSSSESDDIDSSSIDSGDDNASNDATVDDSNIRDGCLVGTFANHDYFSASEELENISAEVSAPSSAAEINYRPSLSLFSLKNVDHSANSLLFSTNMLISLEAMHTLEHNDLRVFDPCRPEVLLYHCPLCDKRLFTPLRYRNLYDHYVKLHWDSRRYVGQYVCFPCSRIHDDRLTSTLIQSYKKQQLNLLHPEDCTSSITPEGNPSLHNRRSIKKQEEHFQSILANNPLDLDLEKLKARGMHFMPMHYHCPLSQCTVNQAFLSIDELKRHCSEFHPNTVADPKKTPEDPSSLHTPLLNLRCIKILPLRNEENEEAHGGDSCDDNGDVEIHRSFLEEPHSLFSASTTDESRSADEAPPQITKNILQVSNNDEQTTPTSSSSAPLDFSLFGSSSLPDTSIPRKRRRRIKLTGNRSSTVPNLCSPFHIFHSLIGKPALKVSSPITHKRSGSETNQKLHSCFSKTDLPFNRKGQFSLLEQNSALEEKKKVRFSSEVYEVTFDKTRSKVEKFGSCLGPSIDYFEMAKLAQEESNDDEEELVVDVDSPDVPRKRRRSVKCLSEDWFVDGVRTPVTSGVSKTRKRKKG